MGGTIDWAALEYVAERFGVEDVDLFVTQLIAIRDHLDHQAKALAHAKR